MAYSCQIMAADASTIHPFSATVLRNVANARIVRNELFALESVFERALPNVRSAQKSESSPQRQRTLVEKTAKPGALLE